MSALTSVKPSMFVALLALAGCSSPDDTSSGSDKSFCYKRRDGTACSCFAEEQSLAASDWSTTTSCTGTCCADTDTSGATSTCVCGTVARHGCVEYEDGSCRCDGSAAVLGPKERAVERCSAKAGQECCEDSAAAKAFCSCEGTACADQRITLNKVSSCSRRATVKPLACSGLELEATGDSTKAPLVSCNGLSWRAKDTGTGNGGGGGGTKPECTSSSECLGKCSSGCYDCRAKSCVCGRKTSAGSCTY